MEEKDKIRELANKIMRFSYGQLYRQWVMEIARMECDIRYLRELLKEAEKFELFTTYCNSMVESSTLRFVHLKHKLGTFEEKKIISEETATHHRKQIQKFDDDFAEIDKINRERSKSDII